MADQQITIKSSGPSYSENLMGRAKDRYGYCELTDDEVNAALEMLLEKYKETGKNGVALSRIRNEIYGEKYMQEFIGYTDNYFGHGYWHCTQQVIDIVNELRKRGVKVMRDVIHNSPDFPTKPVKPWRCVELDPDTKLFRLIKTHRGTEK